jgi:hypothetical protein
MRGVLPQLVLLAIGVLTGCSGETAARFDQTGVPPIATGMARVYVYRAFEPYQSLAYVPVFLNRAEIGAVGPGKVLFRDVTPGTYTIEAKSEGLWPEQAKTVALGGGQTVYAKIESFRGLDPSADAPVPQTTFIVLLIAPEIAEREMGQLWLETKASVSAWAALAEMRARQD